MSVYNRFCIVYNLLLRKTPSYCSSKPDAREYARTVPYFVKFCNIIDRNPCAKGRLRMLITYFAYFVMLMHVCMLCSRRHVLLALSANLQGKGKQKIIAISKH